MQEAAARGNTSRQGRRRSSNGLNTLVQPHRFGRHQSVSFGDESNSRRSSLHLRRGSSGTPSALSRSPGRSSSFYQDAGVRRRNVELNAQQLLMRRNVLSPIFVVAQTMSRQLQCLFGGRVAPRRFRAGYRQRLTSTSVPRY